ncbi:MAG: hypothetical protein QM704_22100 [Anaeromyxobacteraceae bacterium]
MGEETREFASLYAAAVQDLALLAGADTHAAFERTHGGRLAEVVKGALDAVASVHEARTEGLKDWRATQVQVLARVTAVRDALARGGGEALRRSAGELVALLEPRAKRPRRR